MKGVVIDKCCSANDLKVIDIPIPTVKQGWVLVKIFAAGLNHSEALLRMYEADNDYINTPVVPGIECVGEIYDSSDSDFKKGDKIIALMGGMGRSFNGSYAEYALLPTKNVFKVDTDLDWISLAAIPETYFTAYGSLVNCLLLQKNDILLIRGATSTVGQAAVQLAKALGATVISAVRRKESFNKMLEIGTDFCVIDDENLSEKQLTPTPNKILELVGPKTLRDSMLCVKRPGFVCSTGILGGEFTIKDFDPIKYIPNGVFLSGFFSNFPSQNDINQLFTIIKNNNIKPLYSKVFTLDQISEAHTLLEKGGSNGKIILKLCC